MSKRAKRKRAELPFDDPRWLPLVEAHARRARRLGSPDLAARDLTQRMARKHERVRSMRRRVGYGSGPDHEMLSGSFWVEHKLYWSWGAEHKPSRGSPLLIVPRSHGGQIITADAARGYAFFVWGPDFEKAWPDKPPVVATTTKASKRPRRKPGPKEKGDWRILIRNELRDLGLKQVQRLENSGELREHLKNFLDLEIGWHPTNTTRLNSEIRAFLAVERDELTN
jgi:hypothetical protein